MLLLCNLRQLVTTAYRVNRYRIIGWLDVIGNLVDRPATGERKHHRSRCKQIAMTETAGVPQCRLTCHPA